MDRDAGVVQGRDDAGHEGVGHGLVDQQRLGGVADAGAVGLGVEHDVEGHVEVGVGVDVDVAVADAGLDDRHRGLLDDRLDQPRSPARDDEVDEPARLHEVLGRRPVVGGDLLDGVGREAGRRDRVTHDRDDRRVGVRGGRRAAQQHGVAGLEADAGGVGGDVGPSLVDHADDADRDADLLHAQAVGQRRAAHDLADRVGQAGDVAQTLGERGDAAGVEGEPVDHVLGRATGPRGLDVERVGGQDVVGGRDQGVGRRQQSGVLGRARHRGQRRGGQTAPAERPRAPAPSCRPF